MENCETEKDCPTTQDDVTPHTYKFRVGTNHNTICGTLKGFCLHQTHHPGELAVHSADGKTVAFFSSPNQPLMIWKEASSHVC